MINFANVISTRYLSCASPFTCSKKTLVIRRVRSFSDAMVFEISQSLIHGRSSDAQSGVNYEHGAE
jgi:hypothetical protein